MSENVSISVADLIGSNLCVSADDGQKVFDNLSSLLKNNSHVTVSFDNITLLISLFLNTAIGQLYGSFDEDKISSMVEITGLSDNDRELLNHVVINAQKYYANPRNYDTAWEEEYEEDE